MNGQLWVGRPKAIMSATLPPLPKEIYEKYMKPQSAEIWAFLNRDTDAFY
jgi:hypothetical protein